MMNMHENCHNRAHHLITKVPEIFRQREEQTSSLQLLSGLSISRTISNDQISPSISRNKQSLYSISRMKPNTKDSVIRESESHVLDPSLNDSPKKKSTKTLRLSTIWQPTKIKLPKHIIPLAAVLFVSVICTHFNSSLINDMKSVEEKSINQHEPPQTENRFHPRVIKIQLQGNLNLYKKENLLYGKRLKPLKSKMKNSLEDDFMSRGPEYIANSDDASGGPIESGWEDDCVYKVPWQSTFYPTCNIMHELDLLPETIQKESEITNKIKLLSVEGSWRLTWKLTLPKIISTYSDVASIKGTFVLKMLKLHRNFNTISFEHNRVDSIAMERLTASKHVMNEYSFCGNSVVTDFADGSAKTLIKQEQLTSMDRLYLARDLLEGLSDIHSIDYPDGDNSTLIHNDINPSNIVQIDNSFRYNDFNIGVLQRWNNMKNVDCSIPVIYHNALWRSPEEIINEGNVTSKVDVYSIGNLLFQLLTTREPWNHLEHQIPITSDIEKQKIDGGLPLIPDAFVNSEDPAIQAIYIAMLSCFIFDPKERPSSREVTNKLKKAIEKIEESTKI